MSPIYSDIIEVNDYFLEVGEPPAARKMLKIYGNYTIPAISTIAYYIKRHPAKSALIGLASVIAIIATAPTAPPIAAILAYIDGYIIGGLGAYTITYFTDDEFAELCRQLEKELDKMEATDAQRKKAKKIANRVRISVNKAVRKNRKAKKEDVDLSIDLISCMM